MKKIFFLLIILSLLLACSDSESPEKILDAIVKIKDWDQPYYSALHEWGILTIYYDITNTGNVKIDYYKVTFKVTTDDGLTWYDWDNGLDVSPGETLSDYTMIDVGNRKVTKVQVQRIELNNP